MFLVRYRCAYREWWYDDLETYSWEYAFMRALEVVRLRSTPVVIVQEGYGIVWRS